LNVRTTFNKCFDASALEILWICSFQRQNWSNV